MRSRSCCRTCLKNNRHLLEGSALTIHCREGGEEFREEGEEFREESGEGREERGRREWRKERREGKEERGEKGSLCSSPRQGWSWISPDPKGGAETIQAQNLSNLNPCCHLGTKMKMFSSHRMGYQRCPSGRAVWMLRGPGTTMLQHFQPCLVSLEAAF